MKRLRKGADGESKVEEPAIAPTTITKTDEELREAFDDVDKDKEATKNVEEEVRLL